MIASLIAQGIAPQDAAQAGVFLHGLAGERCSADLTRRAMLPTDLIEHLPAVFADYE
jgi:NAD(P)H-hydrate epimerase